MPKNVADELNTLQSREHALRTHFGNKPITLAGKQYTGTSLAAICADIVAQEKKVIAANRAWHAMVKARDTSRGESATVFAALQKYVQAVYGSDAGMVAEFGYKPAEKAQKNVETRAAAVVKLRATRKARNTLGKNQKKSITGTVTALPAKTG